MWTLILTIYIHVHAGSSVAMTTIDNLKSYEECNMVAQKWEKEQRSSTQRFIIIDHISKLCVKKG